MKKIPTLFVRDAANPALVTRTVTPGCQWVLDGLGYPTRKWDGTAVYIENRIVWVRYTCKADRAPPHDFRPTGPPAPDTGKQPGWIKANMLHPAQLALKEAFGVWVREDVELRRRGGVGLLDPWTYELIGPLVNANPEKRSDHILVPHGRTLEPQAPRAYDGFYSFFREYAIEGIVWWRSLEDQSCDKVKIKGRDFGVARKDM